MLLRGSRDPKICSWSQSNVFMCHFVHKPYNERFCSFQTLPAQVPNVFAVLILCQLRVQDPRPGTATGHGKCACACARRAELPTEAAAEDRPPRRAARVSSSSPSPGRPLGSRHRVRAQRRVLVLSLRGWNALSPTRVSRLRTSDAAAGACRARASGSGPGWQARPPARPPGLPSPERAGSAQHTAAAPSRPKRPGAFCLVVLLMPRGSSQGVGTSFSDAQTVHVQRSLPAWRLHFRPFLSHPSFRLSVFSQHISCMWWL